MLARIRQAIREQRYQISSHANEEMTDDDLQAIDIEQIILSGHIARRLTHDPRCPRYEVVGETTDGRRTVVVCRFLPSGVLRIITTYEEEE